MIDTYWLSASAMPSTVVLSGSTSVSDCTITLSAPANLSGTEFDLVITGYAAGDPSNYTVYRPTDNANKTLLYNEGKAVPVCEQSVHIVIPGSGRIRIYETNEEGGAVPYSVWGVYADAACTQELTRATQTTNGFTNTQYLDSDITYYVRQISTVEPYLLDPSVYPVEVKANQTNPLYVTAHKSSGTISISAEGTVITSLAEASSDYGTVYTPVTGHGGVAGAVFTVTDGNGTPTEVTTDGNGLAILSGLPFGTYTVVQTSAPSGIDYDPEVKTVTITYAGSSIPEVTEQITIANSQMSGHASIKKMTETYDRENRVFNPIVGRGFTYGLYAAQQNGLIPKDALLEVLTTDTNGEATSTSIPYGSYYFRELAVPDETIHMCRESFPFTLNMSFFENPAFADEGAGFFVHFGSLWVVACWASYIDSVLMFVFTSTLFKRHKVLQTILWLYVIEFAFSIVLIPVFVALFSNTDLMEGLYDYISSRDPQTLFNWLFVGTNVLNVLLTALFGWLSWRRLKKMPY